VIRYRHPVLEEEQARLFPMSIRLVRSQPAPELTCRLRHVLSVGMQPGWEPPLLGRQTAQRDIWPPSPETNFAYIKLSPEEYAQMLNTRGLKVRLDDHQEHPILDEEEATPSNVALYIWSHFVDDRKTYSLYLQWIMKYYDEIYALHDNLPRLPRRQNGQMG
jgi:hypothetical protein